MLWIVIYVIGSSVMDRLSLQVGIVQCFTVPFHLILMAVLLMFIIGNGLQKEYGLCKAAHRANVMLWYVPLAVLAGGYGLWLAKKVPAVLKANEKDTAVEMPQ